ncbi:hypothetical protein FRC11_000414, partial [Ceratobasidium sp. 423]
MTVYFGTTLAPCFIPFCPYKTALSGPSRKLCGLAYQLCLVFIIWICKNFRDVNVKTEADLTTYMLPCKKKEKEMAGKTVPDQLTGDALNWIILHSQKPGPREMAIRSMATLESVDVLKQLVSNPRGILAQVIQSFTSCFVVRSAENCPFKLEFKDSIDIDIASLHGRALTVLVTQALLAGDSEERLGQAHFVQHNAEIGLTRSNLARLPSEKHPEIRVWALVGLSVWYDFIDYEKSLRFNQGKAACQLAKSLSWSLSSNLRKEVLRALTKEISHWAPNVSSDHRRGTLEHLIDLIPTAPASEQPQLACALSVLALNLNNGASYLLLPNTNSQPAVSNHEIGCGHKLAESLLDCYTSEPEDLARDGQSLLLFALTGLMEYYEHCDFDEEALQNTKKIAEMFQVLAGLGKLQPIKLPVAGTSKGAKIVPVDPRAYFINVLLHYLKLPRTPRYSRHVDEVLTNLLKSINPRRQSWELEEYGPQIVPLVTQLLIQTTDIELQTQCLSTVLSYWDSGPSLLYSRMQLFYEVPSKLLRIIKDKGQGLPSATIPKISLVFRKMGEQAKHFTSSDSERLTSCMDSIMRGDLLEILVDIVHMNDKLGSSDPQDSNSEVKPKTITEVPLLQRVREYLQDRAQENGELLLKKMIEAFDQRN